MLFSNVVVSKRSNSELGQPICKASGNVAVQPASRNSASLLSAPYRKRKRQAIRKNKNPQYKAERVFREVFDCSALLVQAN